MAVWSEAVSFATIEGERRSTSFLWCEEVTSQLLSHLGCLFGLPIWASWELPGSVSRAERCEVVLEKTIAIELLIINDFSY